MKRVVFIVFLMLALVGCGHEETPEYYFDTALTDIENASVLETEMIVVNQEGKELFYVSYKKDAQIKSVNLENPGHFNPDENFEAYIKQIARFYYGDVFTDFKMEDQVVICTIPLDGSEQIVQTAKQLTNENVISITNSMYFEGEILDYVKILVKTDTQTLTYTINLMNLE